MVSILPCSNSDVTDSIKKATALKKLTPELLAKHLQVSQSNPMAGLEGRCNLLIKLGDALAARPDLCATGRPGDLLSKLTIFNLPKKK